MKHSITTTLALIVAGTMTAHAEDQKRPKGDRPIPPALLERFDTNKDGKLDEQERKAAREAREQMGAKHREEILKKFDENGDGKLDEAEREKARAAGQAKRQEILDKYDTNKDGKLDEAERKAAREDGAKLPPPPNRRPGGDKPNQRPEGKKGPEGRKRPGNDA